MRFVHIRSLPALLTYLPRNAGIAVVRDRDKTIVLSTPTDVLVADGPNAFTALDTIESSDGFWVGFCSYDLGREVEPLTQRVADDRSIPDLAFARFESRLVIEPDGSATVVGDGKGASALRRAMWQATGPRRTAFAASSKRAWNSSLDLDEHAEAVSQIQGHLHAGDCYQVNLTRRLTHKRAIDPVGLFGELWEHNPAPHATLLSFGTRGPSLAIAGASPELFLRIDGNELTTCPIKGTDQNAETLLRSSKDAAEHIMIVDLARNDLGRVCIPGTVRVPRLMGLEAHPGLHHLVSTVVGIRRDGVTLGSVVKAMFPAASITGAPKPSVMQIIEDLEPVRRGIYCGAVGWIDPAANRAELAVAIRTFTVTAHNTDLGVGGGIVADSTAIAEWQETELKAKRLLEAAGADQTSGIARSV